MNLLITYPKKSAHLFIFSLLLYEISVYIANDMIMPGMIAVVHSFSAGNNMVPASLTAFILGGSSLQLFLGPLSDRFGRRPVMLTGALFFLVCTIFISISQNITQFILARFFQGMGLCFISVIGYAVLQEILEESSAVKLIAMMAVITIMAPLAGPLLGALIMSHFSWRMIFVIIAFSTIIALVGLYRYMPETVGATRTDGSHFPITPLTVKVISTNYLALLKNRRFILGASAIGVATIPIIAWIGTSPLILIKAAHLSVIEYGLWQLPVFICSALGALIMRVTTYRMTLQRITLLGTVLMALGLLLTGIIPLFLPANYLIIIFGICIYAFSLGFVNAPLNRLTLFSTMIAKGTASAMLSIIIMLLTGLGNQLVGELYSGFNNAYFAWFCAGCGLLYVALYWGMIRSVKTN